MKKIEPANVPANEKLTDEIRSFWTENVNAERIMGRELSGSTRGSDQYFNDLAKQRYRSHRHLLPWIHSMAPGKMVLEIGSGVGLDTFTMAQHGLKITAIDLTDVAIQTVRERFNDYNLEGDLRTADACDLPFDDNRFDYVYSFGVLHHTSDTEKSIDEIYRVLKPGGEARIMLYNRRSLNELVHRLTGIPFEEKDKICPVVRRFTQAEVIKIFSVYRSVDVSLDYVFGEGYGKLFQLLPIIIYKFLSKYLGWHIMIRAVK